VNEQDEWKLKRITHLRSVELGAQVPQLRLQAAALRRRLRPVLRVGVARLGQRGLQRRHAVPERGAVGLGHRQQRVRRRRQAPRVFSPADLAWGRRERDRK
jgi:hypothetical protein